MKNKFFFFSFFFFFYLSRFLIYVIWWLIYTFYWQREDNLGCNVVYVYEGEEETHSDGFREAMHELMQRPLEESGLSGIRSWLSISFYYFFEVVGGYMAGATNLARFL